MKLALVGLSNCGKTTIFNSLTGLKAETANYSGAQAEPNMGVIKVPDVRVDRLSEFYKPKKITFATVEYVDFLGLAKGDADQNRKVLDLAKDSDALVHILRGFSDESVTHPLGAIDPLRDFDLLESELLFSDLDLVEKRLERMEDGVRRGKKFDVAEKEFVLRCKDELEKEKPLRFVDMTADEKAIAKKLQFATMIPEIVVINVGDDDLKSEKVDKWVRAIQEKLAGSTEGQAPIVLSGRMEMEISQLPLEEAREFLGDLGVEEPAKNRLIRESYSILGMLSFLTVGDDEVRAWTIRQGTSAPVAAGKIHSDLQKGFIRAETVAYTDFIDADGMAGARKKGTVRLEGKTYIVKDGDIINFRFNV